LLPLLFADIFSRCLALALTIRIPENEGSYMKFTRNLAVLSLAMAAVGSSHAATTIELQTGFSAAGAQATAEAYRAVVDAAVASPSGGYGSTFINSYDNVSNHDLFGSSTNIAFKSTINFDVASGASGNWAFRAGVDFGNGGAVFLDGQAVDFRSNDMWWAGSYSNPTQFLQFAANIGAGSHTLNIYGLEGCCDGGQQVQFDSGSGFKSFTAAPVPEPETYALMLAGLAGLGFVARRKQAIALK
jgi:hypothetical protein